MNDEERKEYMALSNDPNERGRLWKERKKPELTKSLISILGKLTPTEIIEIYRDIGMSVCASIGVSPEDYCEEFEKNLLKAEKLLK